MNRKIFICYPPKRGGFKPQYFGNFRMDSITKYYQIIYAILKEYADLPYRYGEVKRRLIVSEDKLYYLFMTWGWENGRRLHGCIVH